MPSWNPFCQDAAIHVMKGIGMLGGGWEGERITKGHLKHKAPLPPSSSLLITSLVTQHCALDYTRAFHLLG